VKKIVSMTLVLMTLVFGLVSCSDGSDAFTRNAFQGTWVNDINSTNQITFTGNKFEWRDHSREHVGTPNGETVFYGTYEFGNVWIRWTYTGDNSGNTLLIHYPLSYDQGYEIKGNVLILHSVGGSGWDGRWIKVK
jgi:hypothetical protein